MPDETISTSIYAVMHSVDDDRGFHLLTLSTVYTLSSPVLDETKATRSMAETARERTNINLRSIFARTKRDERLIFVVRQASACVLIVGDIVFYK